jgi:hypothetical protein
VFFLNEKRDYSFLIAKWQLLGGFIGKVGEKEKAIACGEAMAFGK